MLSVQALQGGLAVPDWPLFTSTVSETFRRVAAAEHGGENAHYIPILKEQVRHVSPDGGQSAMDADPV